MHRKLVVVVAALVLVAGACGGGGDGETKATATKKSTTTTERSAPDALVGGDGADTTDTTAKTGTTSKPGSATTTKSSGSAAAPPADPNAAPSPATPGTYDYAQSGQMSGQPVPPNGTLVVNGAGPTQVFQRYFDTKEQPSDIHFSFRGDGPFITKIVLRQQGAVINCTFASPVPAPPWPPTTGKSFGGRATCDGGFQAEFSGSITGRTTDSVGGKAVEAIVVNSTLHITGMVFGAQIDINVKDTQHWAPSLRLPTYSHETVSGTAAGRPMSGDATSTLKSTTPR